MPLRPVDVNRPAANEIRIPAMCAQRTRSESAVGRASPAPGHPPRKKPETADANGYHRASFAGQPVAGNNGCYPMSKATDPESSIELLQRAKSGDAEALDRLVLRYLKPLQRFASGRLPQWARDVSDTQDLVQDTLMDALAHLKTFVPQREGALQAYLRQAVVNRIRDEFRRAQRRPSPLPLEEDMSSHLPSPLEQAIGQQAIDRYDAALAKLDDPDREAIIARLEFGYSYKDIAVMLDRPSPDAARVAVRRALVRLAAEMNNV